MASAELTSHPLNSAVYWTDRLRQGMWPRGLFVWVAALYLAMFILRPWEVLVPELGEMGFERTMVLSVVILSLVAAVFGLKKDGVRGQLVPQASTVLMLYAAIYVSGGNVRNPVLSEPEVTEFLGTVISFFVILVAVRTPYQLLFVAACYFVTTGMYLAKAEWEYVFHDAYEYAMGVYRLIGVDLTFGHANEVGATVLYSLPFWHFFATARQEFCHSWPRLMRRLFGCFLVGYAGVAVTAVFLTRSRSGMVGLAVWGVLVALQGDKMSTKLKRLSAVCFAGMVLFCLIPNDIRLRLKSTWDTSVEAKEADFAGANASAEGRWYGWLAGWEMFRRYPMTGVGIGNFSMYRVTRVDGVELDAHNLPGELLGETGIVGASAFLLFLTAIYWNYRKLKKLVAVSPDSQVRLLGALGTACWISVLLLMYKGLSGHNMQRYNWFWCAAFLSLAVHFARQLTRRASSANPCEIEFGGREALDGIA